ncbi:MAG: hypothetical protein ACYDEO_08825 [Aggregatilineales bacterium]
MRLSPILTLVAALVAVVIVGAVAALVIQPPRALLTSVSLSRTQISPGDGKDDASTTIHYTLNRNAQVTITFMLKSDGTTYTFRKDVARPASDYQVNFSGVVDGYLLPGETTDTLGGTVISRLIPNGDYTWIVTAKGDDGKTVQASGDLSVHSVNAALPTIQDFSASPLVFTPNQDGIDDRVEINAYLSKPATLSVYLQAADGTRYDIAERVENRQPGEAGAHIFDYDGGVDNNVTPPPDGDYTIVAEAQDAAGQLVRRTAHLTIKDSGLPLVEIQPQTNGSTITYAVLPFTGQKTVDAPPGVLSTQATIQMNQGDVLTFRLTVYNYGMTPIRTIGPWPGTVYDYNQLDAAFINNEKFARSGAWRIGFQCETSETSLPWRWAIGAQDQLTEVTDNKGDTFYYLEPGQSATVWGGIVMSKLITSRNPQQCWAALIHEDVAINPLQSNVGPISVKLTPVQTPTATTAATAAPSF